MKTGVIVYKSKRGSAKKYAEWISGSTGYEAIDFKEAKINYIKEFEVVILCGGIYASGIAGFNILKKNIESLKNKILIVFCVGASPYNEDAILHIRDRHLVGELREVKLFYGRGAWNEDEMNILERTLCRLLQRSISKKDPNNYDEWEKALVESVGKKSDWTDKKYITPVISFLKKERLID